jgi:hypothetical protein
MFMGSYRFDGDPDVLLASYDQLMTSFPPDLLLVHVCVRRDDGITIFDSCPDETEFRRFSTSPEFRGALAGAGLPDPVIDHIGDVHLAHTPIGRVPIG